jgi:hypothetical protein
MTTPTATGMAAIVRDVGLKLYEAGIVLDMGPFIRLHSQLKKRGNVREWQYEIDRGSPIEFGQAHDDRGNPLPVKLVLSVKGVEVKDCDDDTPPFLSLDLALEIRKEDFTPYARWHIDQANLINGSYQRGPLFHIQFGGHHHDAREADFDLKVPRWNHPPMDLILLCETVAANFFYDQWKTHLRDDPTWCDLISQCEKFCLTAYLKKIASVVNVSSSTVLKEMWAEKWGTV